MVISYSNFIMHDHRGYMSREGGICAIWSPSKTSWSPVHIVINIIHITIVFIPYTKYSIRKTTLNIQNKYFQTPIIASIPIFKFTISSTHERSPVVTLPHWTFLNTLNRLTLVLLREMISIKHEREGGVDEQFGLDPRQLGRQSSLRPELQHRRKRWTQIVAQNDWTRGRLPKKERK